MSRFEVMPDYTNKYIRFNIVEVSNNGEKVLCYTIRRAKADSICKALNSLERRYAKYFRKFGFTQAEEEIYQCLILKIISW